jgi:restriction endonuclease Mrr
MAITDSKIALIEGETLSQYMIDYGIWVSKLKNLGIKRKDFDYFVGE